jgi:glycosyltransferase involved in cell wall biosynthesis
MKLSYLVSVHNEADELHRLLEKLYRAVVGTDDEIIILDDYSDNEEVLKILEFHKLFSTSSTLGKVVKHHLNKDFSTHKNVGNKECSGDYIIQLDADECLSDNLSINLHDLIESNSTVDLFRVPRVNLVRGATQDDARQWGWNLSTLPQFGDVPIVNWSNNGDRQGRIYRRSDSIFWTKKLHEVISGAQSVAEFPLDVDYAIIHDKTIERQRSQNLNYNTNWTRQENMGLG